MKTICQIPHDKDIYKVLHSAKETKCVALDSPPTLQTEPNLLSTDILSRVYQK